MKNVLYLLRLNYVYKNDVLILPDCYNYICDNAYTGFMSYQDRINDSIAIWCC